jgi:phosphoribosylformylglycinamidine cyclo-ligase
VRQAGRPEGAFVEGAKGVDGGAVRLVGSYAAA